MFASTSPARDSKLSTARAAANIGDATNSEARRFVKAVRRAGRVTAAEGADMMEDEREFAAEMAWDLSALECAYGV